MPAPLRSRTRRIPGLVVTDHELAVPLDHAAAASGRPGEEIVLFAREVAGAERADEAALPWLLFLQGGPGFSAPRPAAVSGWLREALATHRVLLLDQRGTGRSAPVSAAALARLETPEAQARHLGHFRADSIVRDAERFRRALLGAEGRWTVLGQSFGGFCAVAYLSLARIIHEAPAATPRLPAPPGLLSLRGLNDLFEVVSGALGRESLDLQAFAAFRSNPHE